MPMGTGKRTVLGRLWTVPRRVRTKTRGAPLTIMSRCCASGVHCCCYDFACDQALHAESDEYPEPTAAQCADPLSKFCDVVVKGHTFANQRRKQIQVDTTHAIDDWVWASSSVPPF